MKLNVKAIESIIKEVAQTGHQATLPVNINNNQFQTFSDIQNNPVKSLRSLAFKVY